MLHTIEAFDLDRDDFASFLECMTMDLTVTTYADYAALLSYMEGSAAVIGTMMLPILDPLDAAAAREPARQLGLAFQLTNFIRDVAEDLGRGRIYLPLADLERFGVDREDLHRAAADRRADPGVAGARRLRGRPGARALRRRGAGHPHARPELAGLHPHRVPRLRRDPRRGRAGRP